jgi:hypothetical protein
MTDHVTAEMLAAGRAEAVRAIERGVFSDGWYTAVYRAMRAAEPVDIGADHENVIETNEFADMAVRAVFSTQEDRDRAACETLKAGSEVSYVGGKSWPPPGAS